MHNKVFNTFIELCSIASPSGKEERVRAYILNRFKKLHLEVFVDTVGNIYTSKKGTGKPLLLCAHLDTVLPATNQTPVIREGVVYSDGTSVLGADDKSSVAAILEAVEEIVTSGKNHRSFEILFTVREETDGGLRSFPREKIMSQSALIADIGLPVGTIVTAAPFVTGYSITVGAPGSHVGRFTNKTVHPLSFLTSFIQALPFGRLRDDVITNIAMVKMGESYNSVPQSLYFTGELRTHDAAYHKTFVKTLSSIVPNLDKKLKTESKLELFPYCTGYILSKNEITETEKILSEQSLPVRKETVFSVGDFNILHEWGIIPVNIGNGAMDVHTTHEHIAVESLSQLQTIFRNHLIQ